MGGGILGLPRDVITPTATDVTPEGQGGGIFDAPATLIILASDVN